MSVGLPVGSRLFRVTVGFQRRMRSRASTCGRSADGSGRRLSEYGDGRVFLGGGSGRAAGWRIESEPALRLCE